MLHLDTRIIDPTLDPSLYRPIGSEERDAEALARPSVSYWKDVWLRYKKDPLAVFGMVVIVIMTLLAVFGPMLSPYGYAQQDYTAMNQGPSLQHLCGTDKFGRDIFTRILYGARISLSIGFVTAFINMIIGVLYGGIAGYLGGKVDMVMMRIVDIIIALPSLLYIILIMMFLGSNMKSIIIAMCISSWVGTARVVRSQVVSLKHQEYVLAGQLAGANNWQLLIRHLIPNSMGPIIVTVTFLIPSAIFSEAFLSFLGIGIQVPMASWGSLANDAIPMLRSQPYQMIFPVLAISLTMFALNFIGDGLRDALDPKLKK